MSLIGAVAILANTPGHFQCGVTVGTSGVNHGYVDGSFGSITPPSPFDEIHGFGILGLSAVTTSFDFRVFIADTFPAELDAESIGMVFLKTGSGSSEGEGGTRVYDPADANFVEGAQWQWGDGSDPVWDAGDNGNVYGVSIRHAAK